MAFAPRQRCSLPPHPGQELQKLPERGRDDSPWHHPAMPYLPVRAGQTAHSRRPGLTCRREPGVAHTSRYWTEPRGTATGQETPGHCTSSRQGRRLRCGFSPRVQDQHSAGCATANIKAWPHACTWVTKPWASRATSGHLQGRWLSAHAPNDDGGTPFLLPHSCQSPWVREGWGDPRSSPAPQSPQLRHVQVALPVTHRPAPAPSPLGGTVAASFGFHSNDATGRGPGARAARLIGGRPSPSFFFQSSVRQ